MRRLWERVRGELVEVPGLLGDMLVDAGEAMDRWTRRHRWTQRELAEIAAEAERLERKHANEGGRMSEQVQPIAVPSNAWVRIPGTDLEVWQNTGRVRMWLGLRGWPGLTRQALNEGDA